MNYRHDANSPQIFAEQIGGANQQTAVYDGAGQRVETMANGLARQMIYDIFGQNIADYNDGSLVKENVYRGGQLLAAQDFAPPPLITHNVTWTNVSSTVTATGNSLRKTSGASGSWDSGAISTQTIPSGDGYVDFTAGDTSTWRAAGLGNGDSSVSYTDIEYVILLDGGPGVNIYESGTSRGYFGSYAATDHFKVAVESGVVKYYQNSTLLYTSSVASRYPLQVDTSLNTVNAGVYNVVVFSGPIPGAINYVLADVQGSTRLVMSGSQIMARHDYLPFGEEIVAGTGLRTTRQGYAGPERIRQQYAGMERDDVTGLDHTWWRKYENRSGRWTSIDPLAGSIANPQSLNRYAYVQNDPVNFMDPTGLYIQPPPPPLPPSLFGDYFLPAWLSGHFPMIIEPQNPAPSDPTFGLGPPPPAPTRPIYCNQDVIDAMKRAWARTQNGTSGNEAGFVLNGTPSNYSIVDTTSGNTQSEQKMTITPAVAGGSPSTFLLFHVHPNSSTRNPSTPDNNAKGDPHYGDTLLSDTYYQRGQTILFLVGHRNGLTMYDPSKPPSQRRTNLRENLDWTKACK